MSDILKEINYTEFEVEIFNSRNRLIEWYFEELKVHSNPMAKRAIGENYRKIPINV